MAARVVKKTWSPPCIVKTSLKVPKPDGPPSDFCLGYPSVDSGLHVLDRWTGSPGKSQKDDGFLFVVACGVWNVVRILGQD